MDNYERRKQAMRTLAQNRAGFLASALRIISLGFVVSSVSVIIIPAAFLLSRFMGAAGVWHACWVTELVTAAVSCFIYRRAVLAERK